MEASWVSSQMWGNLVSSHLPAELIPSGVGAVGCLWQRSASCTEGCGVLQPCGLRAGEGLLLGRALGTAWPYMHSHTLLWKQGLHPHV